MKCPKCQYLGFETGDRCKNCGYDFSLIEFRSESDDAPSATPTWDRFDQARDVAQMPDVPLNEPAPKGGDGSALPLFALTAEDQPLVRLPVTPRRPLSVRRTPENPRLRATPREITPVEPELEFPEESQVTRSTPDPVSEPVATEIVRPVLSPAPARVSTPVALLETSSFRQRCIAAVIDYTLLFGIDIAIVYFTMRMSGLDMADWRVLPMLPLAVFLVLIALAYVGVFTAIGGQTIGKMVAHIRVVSDDEDDPSHLDAAHAFKRTAAVLLSWMTGGLGFLTVLMGDHRALHDRLSGTRVVDLESA